jgi:hypothetical protein
MGSPPGFGLRQSFHLRGATAAGALAAGRQQQQIRQCQPKQVFFPARVHRCLISRPHARRRYAAHASVVVISRASKKIPFSVTIQMVSIETRSARHP